MILLSGGKIMSKRKTHEEFCKEIFDLFKSDYKIIGQYINSDTKITVQHKCGYEWDILPLMLKRAKSCPCCIGLAKKTLEIFKQEVFDKYKDEYIVLGDYII
jgi:hypothetical protein